MVSMGRKEPRNYMLKVLQTQRPCCCSCHQAGLPPPKPRQDPPMPREWRRPGTRSPTQRIPRWPSRSTRAAAFWGQLWPLPASRELAEIPAPEQPKTLRSFLVPPRHSRRCWSQNWGWNLSSGELNGQTLNYHDLPMTLEISWWQAGSVTQTSVPSAAVHKTHVSATRLYPYLTAPTLD